MKELNLTTEQIEAGGKPITVVVLVGYLDSYTAPKFMVALKEAIGAGAANVVLDVVGLEYMSSAGFGILAGGNRQVEGQGGRLIIAGLSGRLKAIFDDLGLSEIVASTDTRQAAIDALQ